MLFGVSSGISFNHFLAELAPVALVGLGVAWAVLVLTYRDEFRKGARLRGATEGDRRSAVAAVPAARPLRPGLNKSLVATALMLVAFFAGVPVPLAALGAAVLLLVTRRLKPERVFREVDFTLLVGVA